MFAAGDKSEHRTRFLGVQSQGNAADFRRDTTSITLKLTFLNSKGLYSTLFEKHPTVTMLVIVVFMYLETYQSQDINVKV